MLVLKRPVQVIMCLTLMRSGEVVVVMLGIKLRKEWLKGRWRLVMLTVVVCVFFFFQAEDGIRDLTVTGVQTCALPICARAGPGGARVRHSARAPVPRGRGVLHRYRSGDHGHPLGGPPRHRLGQARRSEERRVGKECRSRWSPDH